VILLLLIDLKDLDILRCNANFTGKKAYNTTVIVKLMNTVRTRLSVVQKWTT